jgi:membrane protease YdiL (CAAX protease family)
MKSRIIQDDPDKRSASDGQPGAGVAAREPRGLRALIRRYPLPVFFVLAFALTWATTPIGVFMAAGPLLAAILVTAVVDGRRGLRELGSRVLRWRVNWRWYAAAIFIPLAAVMASGGLNVLFGAVESPVRDLEISALVLMFALRLVVPIFSPIGEEPGWRGFALPRLLADRSPFGATLILAPIVALWHVPLIFIASEDLAPVFLLATVAVTFFYTWLFVHSGGSVLITIIAHASEGVIVREFVGTDGWSGADETQYAVIYTVAWCVIAIALLVFDRQMWRSRSSATPTIHDRTVARVEQSRASRPTA